MPHKKTVLIDLGKLKDPYTGLGQVSLQYGKKLQSLGDDLLTWRFLVPPDYAAEFGHPPVSEILSFKRRYFPSLCPRYDLWHAIHQDSPYFPGKHHKTKYLLTIHDLNFLKEKSGAKAERRLKRLQRKVDRADAVTFISEYTKAEALLHLQMHEKSSFIISNGVQAPSSGLSERPSFLPDGDYIFSLGAITAKKNVHVLPDLIKRLPGLNLVIAGHNKSTYAHHIKERIIAEELQDRVILPGAVDDATRAWLFEHCTAFCFPSLYEGFGIPVIEAMQYGKPVFISRLSSLPEIGKEHAFYWENFDPEHMAAVFWQGLERYRRNPEQFAARLMHYAAQYTWDKNAEAYIALYKELLDN